MSGTTSYSDALNNYVMAYGNWGYVSVSGKTATVTSLGSSSATLSYGVYTLSSGELIVINQQNTNFIYANPDYNSADGILVSSGNLSIYVSQTPITVGQTIAFTNTTLGHFSQVATETTPTLDAGSDSGRVGDGVTSISSITIHGYASLSSAVTLYDTNGTALGTTTGDATTGYWSITTSALSLGVHSLTAIATATVGTATITSGTLSVTVVAPPAISTPALATASDTGVIGDNQTTTVNPTILGSAGWSAPLRVDRIKLLF